MNTDLLTVDAVKRMVEIAPENVEDDDVLRILIRVASDTVSQYTGRVFVPEWQTRIYDAIGTHIDTRSLELDRDLLAVNTLTNGDGSTIDAADYMLHPYNNYPKHGIMLKESADGFTWESEWRGVIQVDGIWGYHESWQSAWISTLDSVADNPLTALSTTITVTDADGTDVRGVSPRFEVLGYYRIEDEVVQVTAVNTTSNTLTVIRGMLGTTAVEHAQGQAITRYLPMQNIEMAALSLTAWLYRNKENVGERYQFLDGTQIVTNEAPAHIKLTLSAYRKLRMG